MYQQQWRRQRCRVNGHVRWATYNYRCRCSAIGQSVVVFVAVVLNVFAITFTDAASSTITIADSTDDAQSTPDAATTSSPVESTSAASTSRSTSEETSSPSSETPTTTTTSTTTSSPVESTSAASTSSRAPVVTWTSSSTSEAENSSSSESFGSTNTPSLQSTDYTSRSTETEQSVETPNSDGGLSGGEIAAIVVCSVIGGLALIGGCVCLVTKKTGLLPTDRISKYEVGSVMELS